MPELIRDGENGLLARTENPAAFVSRLERLIEDKFLRERLGSAARRTIENSYTDVGIARISTEYYTECINGARVIAQPPCIGFDSDATPENFDDMSVA
jgi:glycosyltransferase involved in cell wall biosynthesis